jgi:hypothetical protein
LTDLEAFPILYQVSSRQKPWLLILLIGLAVAPGPADANDHRRLPGGLVLAEPWDHYELIEGLLNDKDRQILLGFNDHIFSTIFLLPNIYTPALVDLPSAHPAAWRVNSNTRTPTNVLTYMGALTPRQEGALVRYLEGVLPHAHRLGWLAQLEPIIYLADTQRFAKLKHVDGFPITTQDLNGEHGTLVTESLLPTPATATLFMNPRVPHAVPPHEGPRSILSLWFMVPQTEASRGTLNSPEAHLAKIKRGLKAARRRSRK